MAYNWWRLGIPTMAFWRFEKLLSPQDWIPHHSKYGAECLKDFWRVAGLQSTLEPREAGFQSWWRKAAAAGETDVPTRKKWKQIRRSAFLLGLLHIWATSLREGYLSSINYSPKYPHELILNQIKLTILNIVSSPFLKFTITITSLLSHILPPLSL